MWKIENAYFTHEIKEVRSFDYLLREIGMAWERYAILLFTTQNLTLIL